MTNPGDRFDKTGLARALVADDDNAGEVEVDLCAGERSVARTGRVEEGCT